MLRYHAFLTLLCFLSLNNLALAEQAKPKTSSSGEVLVDGGNPITEPTKVLTNLASAIFNDKKSNDFRITWSYSTKDHWGAGSAVYSRNERIIKYNITFYSLKNKPNTLRENLLFTRVTDDVIYKLAKLSKGKKLAKNDSQQSSLSWWLMSLGCRKYELKEGT